MDAQNTTVGGKKRIIFVVEDDKFMRGLEAKSLEAEGFEVQTASDAKEATRILQKKVRPVLIILDLLLPDVSGYEFLAAIKRDPNLAAVPVLVLSNLGQEEDVDKAMKLGAVGYLIKANCTFGTIVAKVHEIVG